MGTNLWKIDTQLIFPLAHCASYASNLGFMPCRKGPMNGILNLGPAIDPFLYRYVTAESQ